MGKKRLGIGFLGGGFISRFHIQSLLGVRDVDVAGVFSKTKQSAEDTAALANDLGVGPAKTFENISPCTSIYLINFSLPWL